MILTTGKIIIRRFERCKTGLTTGKIIIRRFKRYKTGLTAGKIIIRRFERYKTGLTTDPSHPFCWASNQETFVSTAAFVFPESSLGRSDQYFAILPRDNLINILCILPISKYQWIKMRSDQYPVYFTNILPVDWNATLHIYWIWVLLVSNLQRCNVATYKHLKGTCRWKYLDNIKDKYMKNLRNIQKIFRKYKKVLPDNFLLLPNCSNPLLPAGGNMQIFLGKSHSMVWQHFLKIRLVRSYQCWTNVLQCQCLKTVLERFSKQ